METTAVYCETKIRTYGFELQEGLVLFEIDLPDSHLAEWGHTLSQLPDVGGRFEWIVARSADAQSLSISLLCKAADSPEIVRCLHGTTSALAPERTIAPPRYVDVVSFHGPHYGDRHGIADYTLSALRDHGIPLLGITCAIAGICLVLPSGQGERAKGLLKTVFEIPDHSGSARRKSTAH